MHFLYKLKKNISRHNTRLVELNVSRTSVFSYGGFDEIWQKEKTWEILLLENLFPWKCDISHRKSIAIKISLWENNRTRLKTTWAILSWSLQASFHSFWPSSTARNLEKYLHSIAWPTVLVYDNSCTLFQGMAFTIEERQILGIHGLLPAAVKTQEEQVELCRRNLERYTDDLSKYIYLIGLLVHWTRRYFCIIAILASSPSFRQASRSRWFWVTVLFHRTETRNSSTVCCQRM